jgi:apolipoprotein N-acyltransferase
MNFAMTQQRAPLSPVSDRLSYLWLAAGAVLLMLSTGWFSIAVAAWLAPVFLIRFFRSQRTGRGYLLILLGVCVAYGIAWRSILSFNIFESWPVYLVLAFFIGLQNSLPFLADRLLAPRLKGFSSTLVYPLTMTAITFLYNLVSPIGSFGTIGYEQITNLALVQLVSITGMWGLTFLVSWLGPVINWAWERSFRWLDVRRGLMFFGAIVGSVLLFGNLRLTFARSEPGTVSIHGFMPMSPALGEGTDPAVDLEAFRREMQVMNDALIAGSIREARRGARIVLWSEWIGGGTDEDANALIARAREVARRENIYLAMGVGIVYPGENRPMENRLIVIAPSGEIVINHIKYGATFLQGLLQGDGVLQTIDTPYGKLSGVICWDADFPIVVRQAGNKQVDILLVPNGEPLRALAQLRAQMHTFRAIENGFSLVRQDQDKGLSIVVDPYGRILASTDVWAAGERSIVAQVPTHGVRTLYAVIGDALGWLSVAGFVVVAGLAISRRLKPSAAAVDSAEPQSPSVGR